ncbi:MAG: EI24 domain-containing protein [Alphaproteobacteria bacterium]
MIKAFVKSAAQISDPAARRVVWLSIAAAIGVFIALWMLIGFLLASTSLFAIGWLETAIDVLGGLATAAVTWLLFPAVISLVIGFLLDDICAAVEARHYPDLPAAETTGLGAALPAMLKFTVILIGLNILMLPFLLTGPLFPFVFYGVNGYLLSREYFEIVAFRRMRPAEARSLRKANGSKLFVAGVIIAFLLTVPVVNLLTPIIATAVMVHLFEQFRRTA